MHCINCFNNSDSEGICPVCGFDISEYKHSDAYLAPGTLLGGRYEIGRVIGEGGFGVTYAAFDTKLKNKCAVKEYFPRQFSSRDTSSENHTGIRCVTDAVRDYSEGLKRFYDEAIKLANFDGMRNIVNVKGYISENNTGYIIMNFIEGVSLKEYLINKGERMSAYSAFRLIEPIISALTEIGKEGFIHRDISPDNIIIKNDGDPVLIDFGSAREFDTDKTKSVILKHGYAPPEQYSSLGLQGPWTDVYALCATIYKMITNIVPADAMDRLDGREKLLPPSKLGVKISRQCENAVMKGLAINAGDRWASAEELYNAIYDTSAENKRKIKLVLSSVTAAVCISLGAVFLIESAGSFDENAVPADAYITSETVSETVLQLPEKDPYEDIASGELENGSWNISYDGVLNISAEGRLETDGNIWREYSSKIKKSRFIR